MRLLIAMAVLGLLGFVNSGNQVNEPQPFWQDEGVLHLYDASCPKGYDYQDYYGAVTLETNSSEYSSQQAATELPTYKPWGTCVPERNP